MSIAFRKVIVCLTAAIALRAVGAIVASASSASASCFKVVTAGTGTFEDSACTVADKTNEYIKISKLEKTNSKLPNLANLRMVRESRNQRNRYLRRRCLHKSKGERRIHQGLRARI